MHIDILTKQHHHTYAQYTLACKHFCSNMEIDGNALELFQTQVEVAIAAADGDLNVAVEILMSQQVRAREM